MNRHQKRAQKARFRKGPGVKLSPRKATEKAIMLQRSNRLEEAESLFERVLAANPEQTDALHFLGVLKYQTGRPDEAVALIKQAVSINPRYADAHSNLGNIYKESNRLKAASRAYHACLAIEPSHANALNNLGTVLKTRERYREAVDVYQRAIAHCPDHGEAWLNMGNALKELGRFTEAEQAYRRAIALQPDAFHAYTGLGRMLKQQQRLSEAAELFQSWLASDPDNPTAQHLAAAYSGTAAPSRAPDGYVAELFDDFAGNFDAKLKQLGYRAPKLVAKAVKKRFRRQKGNLDILDSGCGTGLVAPLILPFAKTLIGVDLSPAMLDKARGLSCYNELHVEELTRYMVGNSARFDLVVSVDTLCYFGDLTEVLEAALTTLRPGGMLIFTVEQIIDSRQGESYRLSPHGRYAHSPDYVQSSVAGAGLALQSIANEVIRKESRQPVAGMVVIATRPDREG